MVWNDEAGRARRPVVAIEDHLYHTGELLEAIASAAPARLAQLTVCVLDRPGPDTSAAVAEWKARYPGVEIVTFEDFDGLGAFARDVAGLVRPGGIVLQDIQLETLPFIPADRWWESIYLGATIRGFFPDRPPIIRFCSNKRGFDATFGKDLLDAGFDPRDVMDKTDMARTVVPALLKLLMTQFPLTVRTFAPSHRGPLDPWTVGPLDLPVSDADRPDVEAACDVVLWRSSGGATLGGRALQAPIPMKPGSPEIQTWQQLLEDRLSGGEGLAVVDVGQRLAEPGSERAEQTNVAARHIHALRARLRDPAAIITAHHRYRLADDVSVALV